MPQLAVEFEAATAQLKSPADFYALLKRLPKNNKSVDGMQIAIQSLDGKKGELRQAELARWLLHTIITNEGRDLGSTQLGATLAGRMFVLFEHADLTSAIDSYVSTALDDLELSRNQKLLPAVGNLLYVAFKADQDKYALSLRRYTQLLLSTEAYRKIDRDYAKRQYGGAVAMKSAVEKRMRVRSSVEYCYDSARVISYLSSLSSQERALAISRTIEKHWLDGLVALGCRRSTVRDAKKLVKL